MPYGGVSSLQVHVALLSMEAKKQASLLFALKALAEYRK
jgi:hypothetical protein